MFINKYKNEQFKFDWAEGSYSSWDPKIRYSKTKDWYNYLLLEICEFYSNNKNLHNNLKDKLKTEFVESLSQEDKQRLLNAYIDSYVMKIKDMIQNHNQYYISNQNNNKHYNIKTQLQDKFNTYDQTRLDNVARLLKVDISSNDILNKMLAENNIVI
jgi:hypothetical protein